MKAPPPGASVTALGFALYKLAEGALCPQIPLTNKEVKWYWIPHRCLGFTTSDWLPAGLDATDHNPLSPAV